MQALSQNPHEQLYDIYLQWHVPFWQTSWFIYTMIVLGIGTCVILGWRVMTYIRSRKQAKDPYWVAARKAIDQLQKSEHASCDAADRFYAVLIMIVKRYLSEHYRCNFSSKTDPECINLLQEVARDEHVCEIVTHVLNGSLTVRFAKEQVVAQMMEDDMSRVCRLIDYTRPAEQKNIV